MNSDRRTTCIGILSTGFPGSVILANPYSAGILTGIMTTAEERDYNVTLYTRAWEDRDLCEGWLRETPVDGVLMIAPSIYSDLIGTVVDAGIPVIAVSADALVTGVPAVDVDNDSGAMLATGHLINLGHKKIAHFAGTTSQTSAFARRDGFYRFMVSNGLEVPDDFIVETGYFDAPAYEHAKRLLSHSNPPTAFFAANDVIAGGILTGVKELGLRVPEDVSVVGYDDSRLAIDANLTSVRQPLEDMGRLATSLLFQRIDGRPVDVKTHLLPAELVVRKSTAPPKE
jgi:LacI family transcriptional regulator